MKKLVTCAVLLCSALTWADETDYILYWQIADNDYEDSVAASVFYTTDEGTTKTRMNSMDSGLGVEALNGKGGTTATIGSVIGKMTPAAYSFFVELYSGSETVWTSDIYAYAELSDYISHPNGSSGGSSPASGTWKLSAIKDEDDQQNVPEPSSGLLMLMGLAGLALRRRKQAC